MQSVYPRVNLTPGELTSTVEAFLSAARWYEPTFSG